jgi:hypothetical protein
MAPLDIDANLSRVLEPGNGRALVSASKMHEHKAN